MRAIVAVAILAALAPSRALAQEPTSRFPIDTATPAPTATPVPVLFPVAYSGTGKLGGCVDLVENGGFEVADQGWSTHVDRRERFVGMTPRTGQFMAVLEPPASSFEFLNSVPAALSSHMRIDSAVVTFHLSGGSADGIPGSDSFLASIRDPWRSGPGSGALLNLRDNTKTPAGWATIRRDVTVDVVSGAWRAAEVSFSASNDGSLSTHWAVDDVSFVVCWRRPD